MKKIITENGEVFYFDFTRNILDYLVLNLYKANLVTVTKKRKIGKKNIFGKDKYESYETKENSFEKVNTHEIKFSYNKSISDFSLNRIKQYVNECIEDYKLKNKNQSDFEDWDGYMGDEDERKKEIMRDQKIKDLLKGDTSKLEKFLDSEE